MLKQQQYKCVITPLVIKYVILYSMGYTLLGFSLDIQLHRGSNRTE